MSIMKKHGTAGLGIHIENTRLLHARVRLETRVNIFDCRLEGGIHIGAFSFLNPGCDVRHSQIGRYCSIGDGVYLSPNRHPHDWLSTHPLLLTKSVTPYNDHNNRLVKIGSDVWIGGRTTIMAGLTIGDGAVIGAGSIVTKDVAPFTIVAGVPAKVIRLRFPENLVARISETRWWDYDITFAEEKIDFSKPESAVEALAEQISQNTIPPLNGDHIDIVCENDEIIN